MNVQYLVISAFKLGLLQLQYKYSIVYVLVGLSNKAEMFEQKRLPVKRRRPPKHYRRGWFSDLNVQWKKEPQQSTSKVACFL